MQASLLLLSAVTSVQTSAAGGDVLKLEGYLRPPAVIERLVTAPRHQNALITDVSPDRRYALVAVNAGSPSLADLARPHLNLGGLAISPEGMRERQLFYRSPLTYAWVDLATRNRTELKLPSLGNETAIRASGASWSPDGRRMAFLAHFPRASYVAVAEAGAPTAKIASPNPLLATMSTSLDWTADGEHLVAVFIPEGVDAPPQPPTTPEHPMVRVADAASIRQRTFRNLLTDTHDQRLLEFYTTGQLGKLNLRSGQLTRIGRPAMVAGFNASPDGKAFRVTTMQKPFSYLVPASSFGRREEVWDETGKVLAELQNRPLNLGTGAPPIPPATRRNMGWHPLTDGLIYLEQAPVAPPPASPEDAPLEQARRRPPEAQADTTATRRPDRLMHWKAPYGKDDLTVLYTSEQRMDSVTFLPDGSGLVVAETVRGSETLFVVRFADPGKRQTLVSWRTEDFYANPGTLVTRPGPRGVGVAHLSPTGHVFLSGTQYDKDPVVNAPRPFLDRVALSDGKKERVWQSAADQFESVTRLLNDEGTKLLVNRQSATSPNNTFLWDSGAWTALTQNRDLAPEITQAQRLRIQITRPDGFRFWARVTVPKWWVRGAKLPAMFWFYPSEFTDQAAYDRGQRTFNKNAFPTVGNTSMAYLTQLGYAVVDPDCPIVGPQGRINDNFIPDLRNNLAATIDELERQGIIDRRRLALGGHSYGAFSTVNAMVHTPFFRAGIAGAGNYNRLLTPMAFQSETRILWEARDTYLEMSPLLYIERLTGALLLYHGMDDQNVGTDPINSERLFHALEGLGKTAALYMYPYEDHGQIARESVLDMWARWVEWLDRHVMKAK